MPVRARRILLLTAGLAAGLGAAILLPLTWRQPAPWPGSMPVETATQRGHLLPGFVLNRCRDPVDDLWTGGPEITAAYLAAQPQPARIEASVHRSWGGSPWKVQLYNRDGQAYVGVIGFDDQIWGNRRGAAAGSVSGRSVLTAQLLEVRVSADTATQLEAEWRRSLDAALPHDEGGIDGTTYFFRAEGRCGRTWSPKVESRNHQLTHLLHEIAKGMDEARLRRYLSEIPPPPRDIPWPQVPVQPD